MYANGFNTHKKNIIFLSIFKRSKCWECDFCNLWFNLYTFSSWCSIHNMAEYRKLRGESKQWLQTSTNDPTKWFCQQCCHTCWLPFIKQRPVCWFYCTDGFISQHNTVLCRNGWQVRWIKMCRILAVKLIYNRQFCY